MKLRQEPDAELDVLARNVIGAAIEVHGALGPGLPESIYERALCVELDLRRIPHRRQVPVSVAYKGHLVGTGRLDLLVADSIIVELKSCALAPAHVTQLLTYLRAQSCLLGLLMNFDVPLLRQASAAQFQLPQPHNRTRGNPNLGALGALLWRPWRPSSRPSK